MATLQRNSIRNLTFEESEKAFKSVKCKKAVGHNDIDSNVIIKVYDESSYRFTLLSEIFT